LDGVARGYLTPGFIVVLGAPVELDNALLPDFDFASCVLSVHPVHEHSAVCDPLPFFVHGLTFRGGLKQLPDLASGRVGTEMIVRKHGSFCPAALHQ
jgi:hypothetical protein